MKFPRCVRFDASDLNIFHLAAEPGEWAVPGGFAFADSDPSAFDNKDKLAFQGGWLGTESFGRASLVQIDEIDEAAFAALIERLARHFVEAYDAPSLAEALPAARAEADEAAALCDHKLHSLLALERELTDEGVVERFRVIVPERAQDHARIWEIVPQDDDTGEDRD